MKKVPFFGPKVAELSLIWKNLKLGKHKLGNMQLLPLQIPSDFPDPALTLAFPALSRGVGNPLAALPVPDPV